jgi:hypothetical protein
VCDSYIYRTHEIENQTMNTNHLPRLALIVCLGILSGFLTMYMLPVLFYVWLTTWAKRERREPADLPHRCNAGNEGAPLPEPEVDVKPTLEDAPLPDVIERWIKGKGLK